MSHDPERGPAHRDIADGEAASTPPGMSEERLAQLARFPEENPNPVVQVSADGQVLYANPAAAGLPGWSCQTGRPLPEPILSLVREALASGRCIERDAWLGGQRFAVSVVPCSREARANLYGRDVTKRRKAEDDATAARQLLETALNHLPAAVNIIRGSDLRLQLVNPAYQAIAPGAEMVGKTLDELWTETGQNFAAICRRVLETGEPHLVKDELNMIRRRPDGPPEPSYFSWSLHRVRLPGDEGWGLLNTAWETTDVKRAQAELLRAKQLSDALNRIGEAVHSSVNFDNIVQQLVSEGAQALGSETAAVSLREAGRWRVRFVHGLPRDLVGMTMTDEQERHAVTAISSGQPVATSDAFADERFNREHMRQFNIRSVLTVPLICRGRPLGAVFFNYHSGQHVFAENEIGFARQLATTASIALENAELYAEQNRAEEGLRRSEERLRLSQQAAKAGSWEWDLRTNRNVWSEELWKMYGITPHSCEPSYDTWLRTVHPEDREAAARSVREAAAQGTELNAEWRVVDDDGTERWLMSRGQPQRDAAGKVIRYLGIVVDITDRKRAEETLRRSREDLDRAQEVGKIGWWRLDTRRNVLTWSDQSYDLFNVPRGKPMTYEGFLEIVHPDDRSYLDAEWKASLYGKPYDIEHRIVAGGLVKWVREKAYLEFDAAGVPAGAFGIVQDITERKQTEEMVHRYQEHLEELVQERTRELTARTEQLIQAQKMEAIGRLAGGVAHDFNNLMTVVTGYASRLLRGRKLDSAQRAAVEHMASAGERAAALTRQLLAFGRKQILQPVRLDLNAVVSETQQMLPAALGEDIELDAEMAEGLWPIVADPTQITQVLMNLAVNARDAMPQGGRLTIRTANFAPGPSSDIPPGRYALLEVADTGVGMDEASLSRVFEPFFTTKGEGMGTGLGLATVYGIVEQSGGHVRVQSAVGLGSTFHLYFPATADTPLTAAHGEEKIPAPGGRESILLVEDEDTVCDLIAMELGDLGYEVEACQTADDALAAAARRAQPFDLLITDVVMPGTSGRALAQELAELDAVRRVLYISGHTEKHIVTRGVLEEGMAFLGKPFAPEELASKVRETLDYSSSPANI